MDKSEQRILRLTKRQWIYAAVVVAICFWFLFILNESYVKKYSEFFQMGG